MKNFSLRRGFTIIEVLVAVAIIVVLSGIVLSNTSSSRGKARDAERISDVGQLQLAFSLYYDRCGQYPATLDVAAATGCPSGVTLGTYISQIPTPPTGAGESAYGYATQTAGGKYVRYVLHTTLEQTNVAVRKGLSTFPGGSWSTTYTCSNADGSTNYCATNN